MRAPAGFYGCKAAFKKAIRRCDCGAVVMAAVTVLNIPEPMMGRKLCCSCAVLDLVIANML